MDELLFYFVVGFAITIIAAIWIKLRLDNTKQEKLIKRYRTDLNLLKRKRLHA